MILLVSLYERVSDIPVPVLRGWSSGLICPESGTAGKSTAVPHLGRRALWPWRSQCRRQRAGRDAEYSTRVERQCADLSSVDTTVIQCLTCYPTQLTLQGLRGHRPTVSSKPCIIDQSVFGHYFLAPFFACWIFSILHRALTMCGWLSL